MSDDDDQPRSPLEALASPWIVAVFALAGLLAGLVLFSLRTPIYESETLVTVNSPLGTMGDEAALVESARVAGTAATVLGYSPDLTVEANEGADLLTITVRANDPTEASRAANQVAALYQQAQTAVAVRVASPAVPVASPVSPNRMGHVLFGSAIGAAVGFLVRTSTGMRRRFDGPERRDEPLEPIRPARSSSPLAQQLADSARRNADADSSDMATAAHESALRFQRLDDPELPDAGDTAGSAGAANVQPLHASATPEPWFASDDATEHHDPSLDDIALDDIALDDHALDRSGHDLSDEFGHRTTAGPSSDRSTAEDQAPTAFTTNATSTFIDAVPQRRQAPPRLITSLPVDPGPATETAVEPASPAAEWAQPANRHEPRPTAEVDGAAAAQQASYDAVPNRAYPVDGDDSSAVAIEAAEARFESELADQQLRHEEALHSLEAHYERQVAELKREVAEARKRARSASTQLKRIDGDDQHRIGDLEAQATALEAEIATLRNQLETERIGHLRELTAERETADRALDAARREFRDRIDAHDQAHRSAIAGNRTELDEILSDVRNDHQQALDRQHAEYESALQTERERRRNDLSKLQQRHDDEVTALTRAAEATEVQLKRQTKQTLAELRASEKRLTGEVEDLRQAERQHRNELTQVRKALRHAEQKHTEHEQAFRDEITLSRKALQTEKDRNAALREDVVRRTAEAHQAVDRAIDERSAQLAELEALVARQRDHAEQRIREATAAAEERVRESARREAELTAQLARLERQLDERRQPGSGSRTG